MGIPKDPEKLEAYRRKQSEIAKARGFGKWMKGKKLPPETIEKIRTAQQAICADPAESVRRSERAKRLGYGKWMKGRPLPPERVAKLVALRKGKTYEEIYGERAGEEKTKRVEPNRIAHAGERPAHLLETQARIAEERRGKTYEEIYGEAGKVEIAKRKDAHRARSARLPKREHARSKHNPDWRYREWRKAVFVRDDYTCRICGRRGGLLHAHHILSWNKYIELRYEVNNGLTVCAKPCHELLHRKGVIVIISDALEAMK